MILKKPKSNNGSLVVFSCQINKKNSNRQRKIPLLIYSEVQPSWFPNVMTRRKIRRVAVVDTLEKKLSR